MVKTPLLGRTLDELKEIVTGLGMPKFTARQLASWMYGKKVPSIDGMTDLSLKNRELLKGSYEIGCSAPVQEMRSVDGTVKYLFSTPEGNYVESVYIPEDGRATLCVSSQVGCKMNCRFCMTGKQGFSANLTAAQILNQIYSIPERETLVESETDYGLDRGTEERAGTFSGRKRMPSGRQSALALSGAAPGTDACRKGVLHHGDCGGAPPV